MQCGGSDVNKSLLRFPCTFSIKAMGLADADMETTVFEIVSRHAPGLTPHSLRSRPSRHGRYVSVTVTMMAESRSQLDAIYRELTACDRVVMAL